MSARLRIGTDPPDIPLRNMFRGKLCELRLAVAGNR